MSFSEYKRCGISVLLQKHSSRNKSQFNILRRSTIGFSDAMKTYDTSSCQSLLSAIKSDSGIKGESHDSVPILNCRYTLIQHLGDGAFSQIYCASDICSQCDVAVKIMRTGCNALGSREVCFLRFLATVLQRGSKHFMEVMDSFMFGDHFCFTMKVMDATIYDLIQPSRQKDMDTQSDSPPEVKPHFQLIHPRATKLDQFTENLPFRSPQSKRTASEKELVNLQRIALGLVNALCVLKKEQIVHADLKPENCFLAFASKFVPGKSGSEDEAIRPEATYNRASINLEELPESFEIRLGDFGNSIPVSEVPKYYSDFDIQSLPYRAPEVLLGLPFGTQIDIWSLGIILVELCLRQPLFTASTREQLYEVPPTREFNSFLTYSNRCAIRLKWQMMCQKLSTPPPRRFAGGKFSDIVSYADRSVGATSSPSSSPLSAPSSSSVTPSRTTATSLLGSPFSSTTTNAEQFSFASHICKVQKLLSDKVSGLPRDFVHFIAGILHPDPDLRLSPFDCLHHSFVASSLAVPLCLLNTSTSVVGGAGGAFGPAGGRKRSGTAIIGLAKLRSKPRVEISSTASESEVLEAKEERILGWPS